MSEKLDNPYGALKRIFHEPSRLAIMSALSAAVNGLSFSELKNECNLTDGNLNRHLKVLEEAGAIKIKKTKVGRKVRTMVSLTNSGREQFIEYLKVLEEVLLKASEALTGEDEAATFTLPFYKPVHI